MNDFYNHYQRFEFSGPTIYKLDGSSCLWKPSPVPVFTMTGQVGIGEEEVFKVFRDDEGVEISTGFDSGYGIVTYLPTDEEREELARAVWPEGFK